VEGAVSVESERRQDALGGLPIIESEVEIQELDLHGGAAFWDEVRAFSARGFGEVFAREMLARPDPPRIWAFLSEPGATAPRIVAMLAVARALHRLGQAVIVIDGDDHHPDLTRWAGRHEQEGWIDFIRYGASLPTCSAPLPWDGESNRLVGVGSFLPALASGFEIDWLLSLLGSQADHLLVAAPLGEPGAIWVRGAHVRVLCWDRSAADPATVEQWLREAEEAGAPPQSVIAFGSAELALLPVPGDQESPQTEEDAVRHVVEITTALVGELPPPREEPAAEPPQQPQPPKPAPSMAPRPAPAAAVAGPDVQTPPGADVDGETPLPEERAEAWEAAPRRSSRLFVRALIALAVVLVVLGVWWLSVMRQPAGPPAAPPPASGLASGQPEGDISASPEALEPAIGEPLTLVADTTAAAGAQTPIDTAVTTAAARPPRQAPEEATGEPAPETAAPPTATVTQPSAAFDPAPYRGPVGAAGWALHVYSLPDSALANRQVAAVKRLGLEAVWRAVELPDRGRWYRVYLGSFPSQAAASAAIPALLARLDESWAQPVQF
jgi:cell division protein FtsN